MKKLIFVYLFFISVSVFGQDSIIKCPEAISVKTRIGNADFKKSVDISSAMQFEIYEDYGYIHLKEKIDPFNGVIEESFYLEVQSIKSGKIYNILIPKEAKISCVGSWKILISPRWDNKFRFWEKGAPFFRLTKKKEKVFLPFFGIKFRPDSTLLKDGDKSSFFKNGILIADVSSVSEVYYINKTNFLVYMIAPMPEFTGMFLFSSKPNRQGEKIKVGRKKFRVGKEDPENFKQTRYWHQYFMTKK